MIATSLSAGILSFLKVERRIMCGHASNFGLHRCHTSDVASCATLLAKTQFRSKDTGIIGG